MGTTQPQYPAEDRRLKALGLVLGVVGIAGLAGVAEGLSDRWLLGVSELAPLFALAVLATNLGAIGLVLLAAGCGAARTLHDPRRQRAMALQVLLANVLVPAFLFGGLADDEAAMEKLLGSGWDIALGAAAYGCCLLAWRLWRRSRRFEAIGAEQAMALDPRPPVLYLRSFRDDGLSLAAQDGAAWKRRAAGALRLPTPEEQMARILARVGPLIAIGKPGELLPELGAARLYVAHDQWQHTVRELMQRAALVVVRVGASPGVLWEIEQALVHLPRQRLVLAILGGDPVAPELVARLAQVVGPSLDAALAQPSLHNWRTLLLGEQGRRIGGMVCFDAEGRAVAVPVQQPQARLFDLGIVKRLREASQPLEVAWKEVFVRSGLDWGRSKGRRSRAVAVVLALSVGYLGAHWFYLGNTRRGWIYLALLPLLMVSFFLAFADALRFIWIDRAEFEARLVTARLS